MKLASILAAAALSLVGGARVASACGAAMVSKGTMAASAQRIFLSLRGGKTEIVVQVIVPRSPADYGALIPLAAQPTIDPVPVASAELDDLDRLTQVDIVEPSSGGGCGCGGAADAGGANGGVLIATVNIGPVTAATLRGEDGAAVNAWLADNGYAIPAAQRALVDTYTGPGRTFVAVKRNGAVADAPDSLGIHLTLDGDQRALPLRFTRIGAGDRLAFTVFVAAPQAAGPSAPYTSLLVTQLDREAAFGSYGDAVAGAVAAHGSRAFVAEYRGPLPPLGTRLATLVAEEQVLTRYSTVLASVAIDADTDFAGPAPATVPTTIAARERREPAWALLLATCATLWSGTRRARPASRW